eukprot:364199-Chlamydomonas_euryale.AAC.18
MTCPSIHLPTVDILLLPPPTLPPTPVLSRSFPSRCAQEHLSSKGLRVLAVCRGELPDDEQVAGIDPKYLRQRKPELTMIALLAILDPPREEVIDAVKVAHTAGISVKMITGDHALTGLAIGKMLGIAGNNSVITGPEIDDMPDEELAAVRA